MVTPTHGIEQLFRRLKEDNTEALTELYVLLGEETHYLCKQFTRHEEDAEDLLQDAFYHLWEKKELFSEAENPKAYFYASIRNLFHRRLQKPENRHKASNTFPENEPSLQEEPYVRLLSKEKSLRIRIEISRLSPQQRNALLLQRYEGLSYRQIARVMGISYQTVKQHIKTALQILRQRLGDIDMQY